MIAIGVSVVNNPPANSGDADLCLISGRGRSPGGGNGNPLPYSCLENPKDGGVWQETVQRVTQNWTWLSTHCKRPKPKIHTAWSFIEKICSHLLSRTPIAHACVPSCFSHDWLFMTLWTIACQAPLSIGVSRQENWSGLACPPAGDLLDPRTEPVFLMYSAFPGRSFTTSATWELQKPHQKKKKKVLKNIQPSCPWGWIRGSVLAEGDLYPSIAPIMTSTPQAPELHVGLMCPPKEGLGLLLFPAQVGTALECYDLSCLSI